MGQLTQRLRPERRRRRWIAAGALLAFALGAGLWLVFEAGGAGTPAAASGERIARIEARTASPGVAPGATVRLDLDLYGANSQRLTPGSEVVGWALVGGIAAIIAATLITGGSPRDAVADHDCEAHRGRAPLR